MKKTSPNPLKLVVGGLQNAPPKNDHKKSQQKSQKMLKIDDFGDPKLWGIHGGWANFSSLFWCRAPLGHQDPSGPLQTSIFDDCWSIFAACWSIFWHFWMDFWTIFGQLFAYFFVHFCMWLGRCFAPTTQNAERRTQPARWRGWPAGQLDIFSWSS